MASSYKSNVSTKTSIDGESQISCKRVRFTKEDDSERARAIIESRWSCSICCETFAGSLAFWNLPCCDEAKRPFCASCLQKCIEQRPQCPFHGVDIPDLTICGLARSVSEYVGVIKKKESKLRGLPPCSVDGCPGLLHREENDITRVCERCKGVFCARAGCGRPFWKGHVCADIATACVRLTPRVLFCPGCGIAVDKTEGCDIIYHEQCGTVWCYRCGRRTVGHECDCRNK